MTAQKNRLGRVLSVFAPLPAPLRARLTSLVFNSQVRFAGTGGLRFEHLSPERSVVVVPNRRKVQNHIGGVHAAAMALLAETATGAVFGMNVSDESLPLLKAMEIHYLKRAQGALRAEAVLDAITRTYIAAEPKGDVMIPVIVTDEAGEQPIQCAMTWAWVPKKR